MWGARRIIGSARRSTVVTLEEVAQRFAVEPGPGLRYHQRQRRLTPALARGIDHRHVVHLFVADEHGLEVARGLQHPLAPAPGAHHRSHGRVALARQLRPGQCARQRRG